LNKGFIIKDLDAHKNKFTNKHQRAQLASEGEVHSVCTRERSQRGRRSLDVVGSVVRRVGGEVAVVGARRAAAGRRRGARTGTGGRAVEAEPGGAEVGGQQRACALARHGHAVPKPDGEREGNVAWQLHGRHALRPTTRFEDATRPHTRRGRDKKATSNGPPEAGGK